MSDVPPSDARARPVRSWRDRARAAVPGAVRGAVLGVLAWTGAIALLQPVLVGAGSPHAYLVAVLVGGLLALAGAGRVLRGATTIIAVLLVLVTSLPIARTLAFPLVRRDQPAVDSGAAIEAVAVLSSAVGTDGLIQGQTIDRLLDGMALARRTGRPLVLSVIRLRREPGENSRADQTALVTLAGLADRTWFVDSVYTTHDEALKMTALARAHGWRRVALVTSPAHTRRACATFEHAGLAVVCTPADARDATWGGPRPLHSAADRLRVIGTWLYEQLGWFLYRARGWV